MTLVIYIHKELPMNKNMLVVFAALAITSAVYAEEKCACSQPEEAAAVEVPAVVDERSEVKPVEAVQAEAGATKEVARVVAQ
jgi:hypothetical protein